MQGDSPLLTIAIPTYNRSAYLDRLLSSIVGQTEVGENIEILVSDNASSDDTDQIVERYRKSGTPIRYIRNKQNLGSDQNFLQCYEEALGRYVWIIGDDDVLEPNAIAFILPRLTSGEFDLVHIRPRNFQGDYVPESPSSRVNFKVFESPEELAKHVHVSFTFISGNIINKDTVSRSAHLPFDSLIGTNLVQLGWTYTALSNAHRSLLIQERLIAALTDNTGGYQLTKVFGTNLVTITQNWVSSSSVKAIIVRGILQKFLPYFLLNSREPGGAFLHEDPHVILYPIFGRKLRYWIFDYPLLRLPRPLGRTWLLFIRLLNKVDGFAGNPLLGI